jgi:putative PIG3 family NAD(P)H quinone oxidoreductase
MRAVIAKNQQPVIETIPDPEPKANELLVGVKATALNRADLLQVQGNYNPPPGWPDTLGLEFAGEVIGMGADVKNFSIGDRVMALVGGGGYAEKATVPAEHAMPIPDGFSYEQAAAIPEVFLTAYSNMVEIGGLLATDTVLIHAGASGVGLACIQIAKIIGSHIIVTASEGKHDICKQYGADEAIDYKQYNFGDVIGADKVDLIIDFIGAPYWDSNVHVLNKWGRLVYVGMMGGAVKEVNLSVIMRKRLTVTGSTLRDRTYERKAGLIGRFWKWAEPHFISGSLQPVIWKTYPLEQVAEAHQQMRQNENAGKIILTV